MTSEDTVCQYINVGIGKCNAAATPDSPTGSWPFDKCFQVCDDDLECLGYSQSISYSSSGTNDVSVYNMCYFFTTAAEDSDGITYGIGRDPPLCMVKDIDTCVARTTEAPTLVVDPTDATMNDSSGGGLATATLLCIIIIPIAIVMAMVLSIFLRRRFIAPLLA